MARKFIKIPQPPIDLSSRSSEARRILPGLLIAMVGFVLLLGGGRRKFDITYTNGYREITNEHGLVDAIPHGGIDKAVPTKADRIIAGVPQTDPPDEPPSQKPGIPCPT